MRGSDLVAASAGGEAALEELNRDPGNVEALARVLFSDYLLPFEVTSVLLVVAIVGVMVLARRMESRRAGGFRGSRSSPAERIGGGGMTESLPATSSLWPD